MHDVAEFLRRHAPFDALEPDAVERIAAAAEIEFFPAGEEVFGQGAGPVDHVWVVRRGAIALVDHGRVLDVLGEGEPFGHPSMLSGLPTGLAARAHEDSLCYRLPGEVARPALSGPAGAGFVARTVRSRLAAATRPGEGPDPAATADRPVGALLGGPPVACSPDTTIREAARRMTAAAASAVVVPGPGREVGIVTDRDLRTRVVGGEVAIDAPVSAVMSPRAHTIGARQPGSEAVVEMLARGVRHLPVVGEGGEVVGVIEDLDLLALDTRAPFRLRRRIEDARDEDAVRDAAADLVPAVIALHDARMAPAQIAAMISVVVEALTRRLLDLALAAAGAPPAPLTWLALGSHARREAVPGSDVDSAIVWLGDDEDPAARAYAHALATRAMAGLSACGLTADDHGVVASRPLFARSLDAWTEAIRDWIRNPTQEKALVLTSMLSDSRAIWGDPRGAALDEAFAGVADQRRLLRLEARFALAHRPPTGFLRDIVVEHSGEHAGRFDIKHGGLLPIAGIARYAGMAAGTPRGSTLERLRAAADAGTLERDDARALAEAYDLVLGLRLEHQVEQLRAGRAPDDFVDPAALNPLTRRYLREAFRAVARRQRAIAHDLDAYVR